MSDPTKQPGTVSIRDYFAGAALSGLLARQSVGMSPRSLAEFAYQMADAMLAARQTTKTGE